MIAEVFVGLFTIGTGAGAVTVPIYQEGGNLYDPRFNTPATDVLEVNLNLCQ